MAERAGLNKPGGRRLRKRTDRVLPLAVPDAREIPEFASHLHGTNKPGVGQVFGWPAEYTPESRRRPLDSRMAFTPASCCIGESGTWFYSLMWEHGRSAEPVEFLDDRGIVK
jgi:hypothetical protein